MRFLRRNRPAPGPPRPLLPEAEAGWIAAARRPFRDFSVGSLVPVVFDRYLRILHPAWSGTGDPVRWETVATWSGRVDHPLAQWDFLSHPRGDQNPAPPFVAEPAAGALPRPQLAALCAILAAHTNTPDDCFVGVWEGYGWIDDSEWPDAQALVLDERSFLVRRSPLGSALEMHSRLPGGPAHAERPTLLWSADRAWFVASDPDLDSTYVGGSEALIAALSGSPDLETWEVGPDDGVSIGSDTINPT